MYDFLGENDEEEHIIGGDFNTVLNSNLDKFGGIKGTHQKCRDKIIASIDNFDLADICRIFNPSLRHYTWNSSSKSVIFSRLDYFLVSNSFLNQISKCRIQPGFISDNSVISLELNLNKIERGKGYFKINNSLVLQPEYQDKIRNAIKETVDINKNANPNTLWEIIKGGIRNETIKYASFKTKEQNKKEIQLNEEINKIKKQFNERKR